MSTLRRFNLKDSLFRLSVRTKGFSQTKTELFKNVPQIR